MSQTDLSTAAYEAQLNSEIDQLKLGDRVEAVPESSVNHPDSVSSSTSSSAGSASIAADSSASTATSAESTATNESTTAPSTSSTASISDSATVTEIIEKDAAKALAAKVRGNAFFARQQYPQAIDEYTLAIQLCPTGDDATPENKEQLSVYYSNRAACYLMQTDYESTIADCTASLDLHPGNPKPLGRRAKAYEKLDQLPEAIDDLKALVAIDPLDRDSSAALKRLETQLNEKNEKMKAEMLGKLKDFGNTILGKFGMSLDNFKATKDPTSGSYNISFGK